MPQAIDLVVKNGASTPVDKTFTLISPAAGDGAVATWFLKEGSISAVFPRFTASARKGQNSRLLTLKVSTPASYTDTVTGLTNVNTVAEMNVTFKVPDNFPEALKSDQVAFALNLMSTPLVKAMIRDAYGAS